MSSPITEDLSPKYAALIEELKAWRDLVDGVEQCVGRLPAHLRPTAIADLRRRLNTLSHQQVCVE